MISLIEITWVWFDNLNRRRICTIFHTSLIETKISQWFMSINNCLTKNQHMNDVTKSKNKRNVYFDIMDENAVLHLYRSVQEQIFKQNWTMMRISARDQLIPLSCFKISWTKRREECWNCFDRMNWVAAYRWFNTIISIVSKTIVA